MGNSVTTTSEEIIIKCSLEEMLKSFFKDYVIVWHQPGLDPQENQQYMVQLKKFCEIFTFTEWQKASSFIKETDKVCHVMTSGTNGELLVKEISQSPHLLQKQRISLNLGKRLSQNLMCRNSNQGCPAQNAEKLVGMAWSEVFFQTEFACICSNC